MMSSTNKLTACIDGISAALSSRGVRLVKSAMNKTWEVVFSTRVNIIVYVKLYVSQGTIIHSKSVNRVYYSSNLTSFSMKHIKKISSNVILVYYVVFCLFRSNIRNISTCPSHGPHPHALLSVLDCSVFPQIVWQLFLFGLKIWLLVL